ncbi:MULTISPECIES: hypothetical protein [Moorena]|uniref:hypothetical protein n=1 Tax=Moorena TaxID=1155738 RepID=UPI000312983B|nr:MULTISPECIES: hypothetical protein [Moorena]NEP69695.1 hypothetical protein [Moorena sp. SIO3A5]NER90287.1 hypothetical protein [Moorena sp. SIO3A2]NES42788.1 hypothetical protein [Moorena sp. SIO2C4]
MLTVANLPRNVSCQPSVVSRQLNRNLQPSTFNNPTFNNPTFNLQQPNLQPSS